MNTIVVGLGNPILGDDGVGWKVIEELGRNPPADPCVDMECLSLGGIGLMEHLIGYDRAVIVDSYIAPAEQTGSILLRKLDDLPDYSAFHITSAHDTSLQNALRLGREMGAHLPEHVTVVGIAIQSIRDFGEELSPRVAECVPQAAQIVLDLIGEQPLVPPSPAQPLMPPSSAAGTPP